jgi:hypothetical protein
MTRTTKDDIIHVKYEPTKRLLCKTLNFHINYNTYHIEVA